ncbi:MAG TPA: hypothetical protein VEC57_21015 [Candidatus Limnocylindrales bacterium]|nr:hypothetical protein [Candidatus Limnocylindrales bacterium]
MVEVSADYQQTTEVHYVRGDTPGYVSPVTGKWIDGARARRDDLARTGSRPWEGMAAEKAHAQRQQQYVEQRYEKRLDEAVRRAYYQLSPAKRRHLGG